MSDGKLLTKKDILQAEDIEIRKVILPTWGGYVFVKTLTGQERDKLEEDVFSSGKRNLQNLRAKLVAMTVVDSDDPTRAKLLFSLKDAEELGRKSAAELDKIFEVARKLAGMTRQDVSELAGN